MRLRTALLVGLNAVLLGTTAVSAADLDQMIVEDAASTFVLTVGAGVAAYQLPDFEAPTVFVDDDPLDYGLDGVSLGGLVGFSASTQVGAGGGYVSSIGVSGFISGASRSSSTTVDLSNNNQLFIRGITLPAGTIDLTVNAGVPSASSTISGTNPNTNQVIAAPVNAAGAQNIYGVVNGADGGFSYAGAGTFAGVTDRAFAFGAIASQEGGMFSAIAQGGLQGWTLTTDITQQLLYTGGDITFSLSNTPESGDVAITGYVGPSYRFLGQSTTTELSVNVGEIQPTDPVDYTYPTYTQTTDETLDTHYLGGVVGGNFSIPVGGTSSLTLGLEGGLYATRTDYEGNETYSVTGGVPLAVDRSVANAAVVQEDEGGVAYALRTQATYTTAVSETMQFSLGVGGEYLSQVATISRDPSADVAPSISYGSMWSATLSASITGQF